MIGHYGGHKVGKGTYWNISDGHRIDVEHEEVLPGNGASRYIRLPATVMLLLGPFLGLAYVLLLPFIAIGAVVIIAGKTISGWILNLIWRGLSFDWRPSTAYLEGRKRRTKKPEGRKND